MPTYEYACKQCGQHLEVVQSFKDDALTECPNCGGPLRKVFGTIGITFKGSGFYKTDSRSAGAKAGASSDSSGSKESASGSDSKGKDSKRSDSKGKESTGDPKTSKSETKAESKTA